MRKILLMSTAVLMSTAAHADMLHCGQAQVFPAEYDPNPVVSTDVTFIPGTHVWNINHFRLDGSIVARQQQYGIVDWPYDAYTDDARWTGDLLRDKYRNIHMVGMIRYTNQGVFYEEQIYNRSHGNRMETRIVSRCEVIRAAAPPPMVHTVPVVPVVPVPVPVAPPAAVQQNGPVVVAPPSSNNVTITIVPGTTWSPTPKPEVKVEPKEGS
jgi:hypothetical protein